MRAQVDVAAELGPDGRTVLTRLRSAPPLTALRTLDGLTLVASAGGPLGGDEVDVAVHVGPGAELDIGSAGAMIVQPSREPAPARIDVRLTVDAGARLSWRPAPTIVCGAAWLASAVRVDLAETASLALQDVVVLGRSGEAGGVVHARLDVERPDRPILRQENLWNDPSRPSSGPAVLAGSRVAGSLLLVGPAAGVDRVTPSVTVPPVTNPPATTTRVARMQLTADAFLVTSLGDSVAEVLRTLQ